jgi:transcriptional regulator with XRE-family HTH domain
MRINVGARLRAERKARNLSQADIERLTGFPRCRISWLENGRAIPTIETLEKLSDALGIPVYQLLSDGEEPGETPNHPGALASNGKRPHDRKKAARLLRELRKHLSRMGSDDQDLLLVIAREMAGREVGRLKVGSPHAAGNLDRTTIASTVGRNL